MRLDVASEWDGTCLWVSCPMPKGKFTNQEPIEQMASGRNRVQLGSPLSMNEPAMFVYWVYFVPDQFSELGTIPSALELNLRTNCAADIEITPHWAQVGQGTAATTAEPKLKEGHVGTVDRFAT